MKITFLGAAHEVTGSLTYIEVGTRRGIVDCGMEQGKNLFENEPLPVAPGELDFVFLTHAHVDHSGRLPLLYKNGYRGPIYASAATCQLCEIMLRDCAHIQMSDAEWKSKKAARRGEAPVEPLYDLDDAEGTLRLMRPCSYGEAIQINEAVTARMTDVGHLLGSAAIELWLTEDGHTRKITFSGDVGNTAQPILRDPQRVAETEFLVLESTYGDRCHSAVRADYVAELASRIQRTLDRGGNLIIPSFAVGRTQEMLYFIREIKTRGLVTGHGDFPVYVDSPLAVEATRVFLQCDTQFVDDEMRAVMRAGVNPLVFPGLTLTVSQEESKAINEDKTPKVIISASGMCDAGRIRHHLKHNLWKKETLVLFVGYQSAGTVGRQLADGAKKVKILGEDIQVNAEIDVLPGVSGHADKDGLLSWLGGFEDKPRLVFVNHGDPDSADAFVNTLSARGYAAYAPYSGTCYDLLAEGFTYEAAGRPIAKKAAGEGRQSAVFARLVAAAERLLAACRTLEGRPNKELSRYAEQVEKLTEKLLK